MWRITNSQYAALDHAARDPYRLRLMTWLRQHAEPAKTMPDGALRDLIIRQEPRAATYGISTERGIARWCFLAVITGEKFDQASEVREFLGDPLQGSPDRKMQTLMNSLAYAINQKEQNKQ